MTGYRPIAIRHLIKKVKDAGGEVSRLQGGKLRISGPGGSVTILETDAGSVDLDSTGLKLEDR